MVDLCRLFQMKHLGMSVYHPQTEVHVKWFSQMQVVGKDGRNWDLLSYIPFAIQETPQASPLSSIFADSDLRVYWTWFGKHGRRSRHPIVP